jgi:hypothetical protein
MGYMSFPLMEFLADVVLPLMIPVLIIATRRRAGGAIIAFSAVALAGFSVLGFSIGRAAVGDGILDVSVLQLHFFLYGGGNLAALAGWTLALYDAVRAQRRQWVAGLTAASVGSWLALYLASGAGPCILAGLFIPSSSCAPFSPAILIVVFLFVLAGPATTLAYGLRVGRHAHIAPTLQGIPSAASAVEQMGDPDAELEIHAEKL